MPKTKYLHIKYLGRIKECGQILDKTGEKCPKCGNWTYADDCIILSGIYTQDEISEIKQEHYDDNLRQGALYDKLRHKHERDVEQLRKKLTEEVSINRHSVLDEAQDKWLQRKINYVFLNFYNQTLSGTPQGLDKCSNPESRQTVKNPLDKKSGSEEIQSGNDTFSQDVIDRSDLFEYFDVSCRCVCGRLRKRGMSCIFCRNCD